MKKVVLITGITGTLGKCFLEKFKEKYFIVGIARTPPSEVQGFDFMLWDVQDATYNVLIDQILSRYKKIDVLINNAVHSRWAHTSTMTYAECVRQFAVNVAAPLGLSNACYNQFWSQRPSAENSAWGRGVVHVGSIAGHKDYFGYGQGIYASTKAALHTLTRHMASDYKEFGLKVNAIAPNSFPSRVGTDAVCESINTLMEAEHTGKTLVVDTCKNYFI